MSKTDHKKAREMLRKACERYLLHKDAQLATLLAETGNTSAFIEFQRVSSKSEPSPGFEDWVSFEYSQMLKDIYNIDWSKGGTGYQDEWYCSDEEYLEIYPFGMIKFFKKELKHLDQLDPELVLSNLNALIDRLNYTITHEYTKPITSIEDEVDTLKEDFGYRESDYSYDENTPLSIKIDNTLKKFRKFITFVNTFPNYSDSLNLGARLEKALPTFNSYLKRVAISDLNTILSDSSLSDEEAIKLVETQLRQKETVEILTRNQQSQSEQWLKIVSVASILVGVGIFTTLGLVLKRLYDSGGTSINFFKPLSEHLYDDIERITAPDDSLLQYLDANLPWTFTINMRHFFSFLPLVKPVDEQLIELREKVNHAKTTRLNYDYLYYYEQHKMDLNLGLMNDSIIYSTSEKTAREQKNFESKLQTLPPEIVYKISESLPKRRQLALFVPSKEYYNGFFRLQRLLPALLSHVAKGNQDIAEKILRRYPELLTHKGTLTDYSGRVFKNITAFQYALWALDVRHMCPMMLDCLPKNEQGERIRLSLLQQFDEVEEQGVTYQLNSQMYQEKHYNFSPLLNALKTLADNFHGWVASKNWAEINNHWCKEVGGAQRYVPAHVAQQSFGYTPYRPSFNEEPFNRPWKIESSLKKYDYEPYFFSNSTQGLGVNFGILHVDSAFYCDMSEHTITRLIERNLDGVFQHNLEDITTLCKVRTEDLIHVKEQLKIPIQTHEASMHL